MRIRKGIFITILTLAAIGGAFSYIYFGDRAQGQVAGKIDRSEELSQTEEDNLISENIAKYQPQGDISNSSGPAITSKSAIVVDQKTNEILYAKNIQKPLPPASIIKMLTLAVALERFDEDELITISDHAAGQIPNKITMKPGERIKLSDLLYGLMMISANDAAYAIADADNDGFEGFVTAANEKARLLGLTDTTMKNPAGLDAKGQVSTAYDLATITRYTLLNHPQVIKYAGKTSDYSIQQSSHNEAHWWFGHLSQMLTSYKPMIAAKTGYTDIAGNTYIGIAEKGSRRLVLVILGGKNAGINTDVKALLDYGFSR